MNSKRYLLVILFIFILSACRKQQDSGILITTGVHLKSYKQDFNFEDSIRNINTYIYTYDNQGRMNHIQNIENPEFYENFNFISPYLIVDFSKGKWGNTTVKVFLNSHSLVDSTIVQSPDSISFKYRYDAQDRSIQQTSYRYIKDKGFIKSTNLIITYDFKGNAIKTFDDVNNITETDTYYENLENNRPATTPANFSRSNAYFSSVNLLKTTKTYNGVYQVSFDGVHTYNFDEQKRMINDTLKFIGDKSTFTDTFTY